MRRLALLTAMSLALPLAACGSKGPSEADIEAAAQAEMDAMFEMLGMGDVEMPEVEIDVSNVNCTEGEEKAYSCEYDVTASIMGEEMEESMTTTFKKEGGKWVAQD